MTVRLVVATTVVWTSAGSLGIALLADAYGLCLLGVLAYTGALVVGAAVLVLVDAQVGGLAAAAAPPRRTVEGHRRRPAPPTRTLRPTAPLPPESPPAPSTYGGAP